MPVLMKLIHLAAAIVWLGGAAFMLLSLKPALEASLEPAQRLPLVCSVMTRFFRWVWLSIGLLLLSGLAMLASTGMKNAPVGWHLMLGLGLAMFALFGHLYFGPFRRLRQAVQASDWAEGGRRVGQIARLVWTNLLLGALAIGAVLWLR